MRIVRMLMVSLVLAGCASGGQEGASTTPASPAGAGTQKSRIVEQVRSLESDPLQAGATQLRQRLMRYFEEAPDITITVCSGVLDPIASSRQNHGNEIFVQQILSSGAFIIENPGMARDQAAVHAAGVEGALRTYESILRARPDARLPLLDQLVQLRARGELAAHVRSRMGC
ncbi:MAG TPA: hypothetical protein VGB92_26775 [Longimicrobium sp.]